MICGGSAVPLSLMQQFEQRHNVKIIQAWGMTETSPLGSVARPPRELREEEHWRYRATAGTNALSGASTSRHASGSSRIRAANAVCRA